MSDTSIPGLDKLERRTPLPSLAELLGDSKLPPASLDLPPLQDLEPALAQLPKFQAHSPTRPRPETLAPIPSVSDLVARVARSMEESPAPMPSPSGVILSTEEEASLPEIPVKAKPVAQGTSRRPGSVDTSYPIPSPFEPKEKDLVLPGENDTEAASNPPEASGTAEEPETFTQSTTDEDLIEAMLPIVESSLEKALYAPKTGLHTYLEPMLRSTVRRAIAEQMLTAHHFGQISFTDRMSWRMKAFFTSQTYDDIIFEQTHRYRVEEVFLMRYDTHSLISYASHDPSRHANPRKIRYDVSKLMGELKDQDGNLKKNFDLPDKRLALIRSGRHCFMVAVIRGRANALVRADLDYTLEQIEQRFEKRLRPEGHHFVHVLQPILEGCLLIQSPPSPS
ncbi:MAG: hypothetical protein ACSHYF_00530 [Verrucomicrobiaceae bacterium]